MINSLILHVTRMRHLMNIRSRFKHVLSHLHVNYRSLDNVLTKKTYIYIWSQIVHNIICNNNELQNNEISISVRVQKEDICFHPHLMED